MKLRRLAIENVRSFLDRQEFHLPGDLSIVIGPNGGGKTNLLDTAIHVLRAFFLRSWALRPRHMPTPLELEEWAPNDAFSTGPLEKHSDGSSIRQSIELDLEVTKTDIDNINRAKAEAAELVARARSRYIQFPGADASTWITDGLQPGSIFSYEILNGSLSHFDSPIARTFLNYLETFEVFKSAWEEGEQSLPSMPMLSLPVNRSVGDVATSISLPDFNDSNHKRTVDAASSRVTGSIRSLAIGRLATRLRERLELDEGQAKKGLWQEPTVVALTAMLTSLGYDWDLRCTNRVRNQYEIFLLKQGKAFPLAAASSGEREILTYLFAIYGLNVKDALILIDEPELHLHPRWQRTLLAMFERLSAETGNQFVMATHSPVFVSPSSMNYISRVYAENQQSRVVQLAETKLPNRKHLFNIVNSQNNERLFFADLVVLVEGISDRIFFEALFRQLKVGEGLGKVYEIVSVGGKSLFTQYETLLKACKVPYVIIADLDYIKEAGTDEIKGMFSVSAPAIKQNVIDDPASIDGASLVARLDEAIQTVRVDDLRDLWEYIKARQSRLRAKLTAVEQERLQAFIAAKRLEGCFILSQGTLEAYLPHGGRVKDVENVIALSTKPNLLDELSSGVRPELETIVKSIAAELQEPPSVLG